ncbi:DUF333 domain-containing protein [Methanoplanus sp. FWC-SCC4]|uniref:DUF333 domain-containing protein n=1 Tax=Methanochimaera problematica TaxID=2609417 RepID=A0AA97I3H3_9EURY|nr:DUF333 domain-containing protein [Methanoplanus sp. FWC-SCC4]WOF15211.1 DUF333 domain-containing protein [Methanoplanus sp. FWC-SCC4]
MTEKIRTGTAKKSLAIAVFLIAIAVMATMFAGCTGQDNQNPATPTEDTEKIVKTGTVTYIDLEGGFYGIIADDGTKYLPLNLDDYFKKDNLTVKFTATEKKDTMTVQQWGTPVEIEEMEISDVSYTHGGMIGMANPSAVWCDEQGYEYKIVKDTKGSEYGIAVLPDGTEVIAWDLYYKANGQETVVNKPVYNEKGEITGKEPVEVNPEYYTKSQISGMANPSAVWCEEQGYEYKIVKDTKGSEYGIAVLPDGTEVIAWDLYYKANGQETVVNKPVYNEKGEITGTEPVEKELAL